MAVHRERVDPVRTPEGRLLVHRRWILPDDLSREIPLMRVSPLWRGLCELDFLNPADEVSLERLTLPPAPGAELGEVNEQELPAIASAGALLGGAGTATLVTQMVWLEQEERRDPYAQDGESDVGGWRDYTLYVVAHERFLLMPMVPDALVCAQCGRESTPLAGGPGEQGVWRFGEAALLDLSRRCPHCSAALDLGRDRARLRNGAVFLLEECCARAALSIEMPSAPEADELPDAVAARLLIEAFGGTDELTDDRVTAAQ